ncbi:lytic transglycosylase domain-containing protein [Erythrobacter sp. Alg231-14]|uniref:lytic transglycosylase domain-containing protein n=1 Tax=Erythrobacter sp. Alg231-14 TaxID=1922225 RepID=UPI00307C8335
MILATASRYGIVIALVLSASIAHADVMVIDDTGARWVAGGPSDVGEVSGENPNESINLAALEIPDRIVGNMAAHASDVPPQYAAKIQELARRFDLSASLLEAVVWQESRWREDAVSHAGARGLAQLMPGTAEYLGVDPDDPMQNLEGGARYLREQLDLFDGDLEKALAAYNAGPGRVLRADGIPNIRETQNYVAAIMGRLADHSRPERSPSGVQ